MAKKEKITVQGTEIMLFSHKKEDYISLTDMARYKDTMETSLVISHWLSTRYTIEFMGIWESVNNPNFNPTEFGRFRMESGSNGFVLTSKRWVERTNAIGIFSKSGRYGGGTFAHKDIAFEFGSWLSAEFKFYLIKEFQRLKEDENQRLSLEWNLQRTLAKVNYQIHTSAISLNYDFYDLFDYPDSWSNNTHSYHKNQINHSSDNMESINALLIQQKLSQSERLQQLNSTAIMQMQTLLNSKTMRVLN